MEYVAIMRHGPQSCPGSSAQVSEWMEQIGPRRPEVANKHQVTIRSSHVLSPAHIIVLILDGPNVESAREFLEEGGFTQWNDVELYPSMSMQERQDKANAMGVPTIW